MRTKSALFTLALVGGAALLAACSGNGASGTQSSVPGGGSTMQTQAHGSMLWRTGIDPAVFSKIHARHAKHVPARPRRFKELAVSDAGLNEVVQFNRTFGNMGSFSNSYGDGIWIDPAGNIYVADYASLAVDEYDQTGTLLYTYNSGLTDPVDVTTDSSGNVYVANYGSAGSANVVEYPPMTNTPTASCNTNLANEGLIVDKTGDLFVTGNNSGGTGNIYEFAPGGLASCSWTTLTPTLTFAGGITIDNTGALVVCDQLAGIDIIPPPYTSISKTITVPGGSDYFHDALTGRNTKNPNGTWEYLFIADAGTAEVYVLNYTNDSLVTTLNSSNGLSLPYGVATYKFKP
ncbi:MAG: hypothetical protein JO078_07195 [Candidatus Eremiobacteraeota bacterium]|nr:hypothetical protein [Candidatus Eremiobacteraeota bacterium]MBV9057107.1 hypothetical protein [Candidatus Eremiobacteraeota bacterium]MBV9699894.1 hypothetical protein [Candidatus Eremiobacteraeota bacterium]